MTTGVLPERPNHLASTERQMGVEATEAARETRGIPLLHLRWRQTEQLFGPVWRSMRWMPLAASMPIGLALVHAGRPVGWAGTPVANLPEAGTLLCFGAAFALDDPAGSVLAASPSSLLFRRALRVGLVVPVLAMIWSMLLWHARVPADGWTLTLGFFGMITVTLALAAVAAHLLPDRLGGVAVGPALLVMMLAQLLIPEGWRFLPLNFGRHWVDAGPRAAPAVAVAALVFLLASRDPATRWRHRRRAIQCHTGRAR